jgi:hypothetical protein
MNDELIRFAIEAGFEHDPADGNNIYFSDGYWTKELARFADLVAAAERERFALECIDLVAFHGGSIEIEAAIRARGQE